jgi:hypothetical protein
MMLLLVLVGTLLAFWAGQRRERGLGEDELTRLRQANHDLRNELFAARLQLSAQTRQGGA